MNQQKNDIFVGNLAFNTTEDQLHVAFSDLGRVINVRMVTDPETGKSRGFAFVEFEDPHAALSAIRNMDGHELNGRRLRVNYSNSSHLEQLAASLGMNMANSNPNSSGNQKNAGAAAGGGGGGGGPSSGTSHGSNQVSEALRSMSKAEMYDVVAKLKEIADQNPDEARRILAGHPQLPEAMLFLMSKLDMVQSPLPTAAVAATGVVAGSAYSSAAAAVAPPPPRADPRMAARVDPRQQQQQLQGNHQAASAAAVPRSDPRQRVDPRQQLLQQQPQQQQNVPDPRLAPVADPRQRAPALQPMDPRRSQQQQLPGGRPPPPPPPPHFIPDAAPHAAAGNLDPQLVQQVMNLTPQEIAQLPPDKQNSILQLRSQITGGR